MTEFVYHPHSEREKILLARIQELEVERDRARDFAIGCLDGSVENWSNEFGESGTEPLLVEGPDE